MKRLLLYISILVLCLSKSYSQIPKYTDKSQWIVISDDDIVTIAYSKSISTDKKGYHYLWVKADYHWKEWQDYFSEMIESNTPVKITITKAQYTEDYNFAMVRQILLYSQSGRLLHDTGDDRSAGWLPVNASDPIGIVGEYLGDIEKETQ